MLGECILYDIMQPLIHAYRLHAPYACPSCLISSWDEQPDVHFLLIDRLIDLRVLNYLYHA